MNNNCAGIGLMNSWNMKTPYIECNIQHTNTKALIQYRIFYTGDFTCSDGYDTVV